MAGVAEILQDPENRGELGSTRDCRRSRTAHAQNLLLLSGALYLEISRISAILLLSFLGWQSEGESERVKHTVH